MGEERAQQRREQRGDEPGLGLEGEAVGELAAAAWQWRGHRFLARRVQRQDVRLLDEGPPRLERRQAQLHGLDGKNPQEQLPAREELLSEDDPAVVERKLARLARI